MTETQRINDFRSKYSLKDDLLKKYRLAYLFTRQLLDMEKCQALLERHGFTVRHKVKNFNLTGVLYADVFHGEEEIGFIDLQGFPSIQLDKCKKRFAKLLVDDVDVIEPIKSMHRILDWHEVKGKLHMLAGGQTVLHVLPVEITDAIVLETIKKHDLQGMLS